MFAVLLHVSEYVSVPVFQFVIVKVSV